MKKIEVVRINPYSVVTDILQNAMTIVLATIVAFVGSFIYLSYIAPKEYTSTMLVSVNLSGYTSQSTSLSLARTVSIAEKLDDVFKSDAMIRVAENELGSAVTGTVNAEQMLDTNLIKVSVTEHTPDRAFEVLQTIAVNHYQVTDYSFTNVIIRIISNPNLPTSPSNTVSTFATCVLVALVVGMAMAALIFLMSYMRDTVKNISDVELELNAKLFGTVRHLKWFSKKIPEAKRRLILSNVLVGYDFTESFRKMAIKIESLTRTKGVKTFMVTSAAENEGKTTISVNLAVALAQSGHKVLLIDCDLKKPSIKNFFENISEDKEKDFYKYLEKGGRVSEYIKFDTVNGISLLTNSEGCTRSADKLASHLFSSTLKSLKSQFDYIIIDTPPSGILVDAEIIAGVVDASFIVVRQDFVRVTDINDQIESINKNYFAGCIFNDVHELRALSEATVEPARYNPGVKS